MPFGIGPAELILILVVALVVFGPRRLPELGSSMGKAIREFRRATSELSHEMQQEIRTPPATPKPPAQVMASQGSEVVCAGCDTPNPASQKYCGNCGKAM